MILSKEQIENILKKMPEERGIKAVECFMKKVQPYLDSGDVKLLYDKEYEQKLENHQSILVQGKYKIHIFARPTFEYLDQALKNQNRILEIGCGSGNLLMALACRNRGGQFIGIDFNPAVIRQACEQAERTKLHNCKFECCDANEFNSEEKFDYIILSDVIEHLSDRELEKLLYTSRKLLNDHGEIIMHTPNGLNQYSKTDKTIWEELFFYAYFRISHQKYEKSVEQLYYEQVHINVKSYRKWKAFFKKQGYTLAVKYDVNDTEFKFVSWESLQQLLHLGNNMLLIAQKS